MRLYDDPEKIAIDGLSVTMVAGALLDMLPAVAAVLTIVWTGIRIYETETVQKLLGKKKPPESEDTEG